MHKPKKRVKRKVFDCLSFSCYSIYSKLSWIYRASSPERCPYLNIRYWCVNNFLMRILFRQYQITAPIWNFKLQGALHEIKSSAFWECSYPHSILVTRPTVSGLSSTEERQSYLTPEFFICVHLQLSFPWRVRCLPCVVPPPGWDVLLQPRGLPGSGTAAARAPWTCSVKGLEWKWLSLCIIKCLSVALKKLCQAWGAVSEIWLSVAWNFRCVMRYLKAFLHFFLLVLSFHDGVFHFIPCKSGMLLS